MFWIRLLGLVLLYLLALPINIVVSFFCEFVWYPSFRPAIHYSAPSVGTMRADLSQGQNMAYSLLDIAGLAMSGDGPKFLGMAYYAVGAPSIWEVLISMCGDRTFYRTPQGVADEAQKLPVFSGDQLSGYLLGLFSHKQHERMTCRELERLRKVFESIIFEGIPFVMEDVNGKYTLGRGWVWTPWEPCFGTFSGLFAFLGTAAYLFPDDPRYKRLITFFKILSWPVRFSKDFNFWAGRVYMQTWYTAHSNALNFYLLEQLGWAMGTEGLNAYAKRYPWNVDICCMACKGDWDILARDFLSLYPFAYRKPPEAGGFAWHPLVFGDYNKVEYISVRSFFKKKEMYDRVLDSIARTGGKYMHEENPLLASESLVYGMTVDFLFPAAVWLHNWKMIEEDH